MVHLLSYNIHCGIGTDGAYDLERVADVIRRSEADIACLQEVEVNAVELKARKWSQPHADNQPKVLSEICGLQHSAFAGPLMASLAEQESGFFAGEVLHREEVVPCPRTAYGMATLSRYPILDTRRLVFERLGQDLSDSMIYMDREEQPRGALAVLVDGGADTFGPLWVVNTHLSHKFSSAEQRRQADQLVSWVHALCEEPVAEVLDSRASVLLCGDLNSTSVLPFSAYSVLASHERWEDLWKQGGSGSCQVSFPSNLCFGMLGLRIDHIFALEVNGAANAVCDEIRVVRDMTADVEASDHCAVLAHVEFRPLQACPKTYEDSNTN
eukprot:TRINITY_DN46191_c0_g1_i1.p1 TRINITY_DN46191_c0_g1~~TRINITY_DN46191_c0_g1_i1.p1  ORF type:complete len:326 (-),score=52.36 TRINITY_DN46191_c0_g1_i1:25-1002(-)